MILSRSFRCAPHLRTLRSSLSSTAVAAAAPASKSHAPAVTSLTPQVKHLRTIFKTDCSKEALKAGAQAYLNFMSVSGSHGWRQAFERRMLKERIDANEQALRDSRHYATGSAYTAVYMVGRVERDQEYLHGANAMYLQAAAARYLYFTKLRSEQPDVTWVPPRDVSVFWHAELLRPTKTVGFKPREVKYLGGSWFETEQIRLLRYGTLFTPTVHETLKKEPNIIDSRFSLKTGFLNLVMMRMGMPGLVAGACFFAQNYALGLMYPKVIKETAVETTLGIKAFDSDSSGKVTRSERSAALKQWQERQKATEQRWREATGTSYAPPDQKKKRRTNDFDFGELFDERKTEQVLGLDARETRRRVNELVNAVQSQSSLVSRMLALGPGVVNDAYIDRAVDRYCQFLAMAANNPGQMLVPTLDIDLIWHVHMLSSRDYHHDCEALLGRLLNHDAELGKDKIAASFAETQKLYAAAYGAAYVSSQVRRDNETKRTTTSDFGARGSRGREGIPHTPHQIRQALSEAHQVQLLVKELAPPEPGTPAPEFGSGNFTSESSSFSHESFNDGSGSNAALSDNSDGGGNWFDAGDGGGDSGGGCGGCGGCGCGG